MQNVLMRMAIILMHLVTIGFSYSLFRIAGFSLKRLSIPMWLYVSYLLFSFLFMPAAYWGWFPSFRGTFFNTEILGLAWILSGICLIFMTLGYVVAVHIFKIRVSYRKVTIGSHRIDSLVPPLVVFGMCIVAFVLYVRLIPEIPLFVLFKKKSYYAARIARSMATNAFEGGKLHYYSNFFEYLLPFVTLYIFGIALQRRNNRLLLVASGCILFTAFVAIHATAKAVFFDFLVALLFTYLLLRKRGRISFSIYLGYGVLGMILLTVLFRWFFAEQFGGLIGGLFGALIAGVDRLTVGQIQSLYWNLAFVKQVGYFYGTTFPNPMGIFPWKQVQLNLSVANFAAASSNSQVVGSYPAVFWTEVYANFGVWVSIVSAFFVGLYVCWLNSLVSDRIYSSLHVALMAWLMVFHGHLARISIALILPFPVTLLFVLLWAWVFSIIRKLNVVRKLNESLILHN